jgi:hypothetical protein
MQNDNRPANPRPPRLERRGNVTQLIVDDRPYLVLGGEVRNSSSSSLDYMEPVWRKLKAMRVNTVLAPVTWEQIEAVEEQFDFTVTDGLIAAAREHGLRLILLWFGSWKNGTSRYAPPWVKRDQRRFPRVRNRDGRPLEILSTFGTQAREADARAFATLMRHLGELDGRDHTVIMMQVQNEVGVLGDSRDRSDDANEAFAGPVPDELLEKLHKKPSGSWESVFGPGAATDEIFMAWHYARFCDHVARAGKAEYDLPMFVNAWIVQPDDKQPGDWPSGGPVDHAHEVWRAGAPSIDILAPDIYLPNFNEMCDRFTRGGNPLFVPESRAGAVGAANSFYAIGRHGAIGYSPFAIEDRETDPEHGPISRAYAVIAQLAPMILEHQARGSIAGVSIDQRNPSARVPLGGYSISIELRRTRRSTVLPELGYAMILATAPDEFLIAGTDVQITFASENSGSEIVGLARVEEGWIENGTWVAGRLLNGDEVQLRYDLSVAAAEGQSGAGLRFGAAGPTLQRVRLYRYR